MPKTLLFLLFVALAGCDTVLDKSQPQSAFPASRYYLVSAPMPANLAKENCGAQALGAATAALRPPGVEFPAALLHLWEHDGATPLDILIVARGSGFNAELEQGDWAKLMQLVQTVSPAPKTTRALVEFDSTIEVWTPFGFFRRPRSQSVYHWSTVAGMAKDGSAVVLAAPGGRDYIIPHDSFMRRWSRADDCLITIAAPP